MSLRYGVLDIPFILPYHIPWTDGRILESKS